MAEERKMNRPSVVRAGTKGDESSSARKSSQSKSAKEVNIEEIVKGLEDQAGKVLENLGSWVNQGDELIGKARSWLKDHPVATAVAVRYARKADFIPSDLDEARERAREAGERIKSSARSGINAVKENPWDAVLIGAGLGLATVVAMRNRMSQNA